MCESEVGILVVGGESDPHVSAVLGHLDDCLITLIDAVSLPTLEYEVTPIDFELTARGGATLRSRGTRGWIRRLAPADWGLGQAIGSHTAVAQASLVSLLAAIARTPGVTWLTDIDPLVLGESKLLQMRAAGSLGIRTPRTIVTNSRERAERELGAAVVVKPLGPGHFTTDQGESAVAFATAVDLTMPAFKRLGPSPFLIQEIVRARTHLRAVTVQMECWLGALDAADYPLDWRADDDAHHAFALVPDGFPWLRDAAPRLARAMGLGYSSQDWIHTEDGDLVLLDVNPAGQWLFLPDPIGREVARAIAGWLRGPKSSF